MMRSPVVVTLLCYIQCAAALTMWQNGVEVDFSISVPNMCHSDVSMLKLMFNIPMYQCIVECGTRQRCQGVHYRMHGGLRLCKLLRDLDEEEFTAGDCVLVRRSDITMKNLPCSNCEEQKACDLTTKMCVIKECAFPTIDNGVILGNKNEIGSRLRVKCDPDYKVAGGAMVCSNSGSWADQPVCVEVSTLQASGTNCSSHDGTLSNNVWCYNNCYNVPPFCPSSICTCD